MASSFMEEEFFNLLFDNACGEYRITATNKESREKQLKMISDCETKMPKEELNFVHDCFGLITEVCETTKKRVEKDPLCCKMKVMPNLKLQQKNYKAGREKISTDAAKYTMK